MTWAVDAARFGDALPFTSYLETVQKNVDLWRGVYRTASSSRRR